MIEQTDENSIEKREIHMVEKDGQGRSDKKGGRLRNGAGSYHQRQRI